MIMKSNYQSTPIEHLENRRPKCKMHTQERQLTRFFVFYNWSTKKTEPNWRFFFKTEPNSKNPFRTSLYNSMHDATDILMLMVNYTERQ